MEIISLVKNVSMRTNHGKKKYNKILFLGNGINRAFNGLSWQDLLNRISKRTDINADSLKAPMPLRAVLLTNDGIDKALEENHKYFFGKIESAEHAKTLRRLLTVGFDDILTVNYSYELEATALGQSEISEKQIKKKMDTTGERAEPVYLLHTYNKAVCDETVNRIWHIHGESRKPGSMILGHYLYGNLLGRIRNELDRSGKRYDYLQKHGKPIGYDSWIDSFILGDVYILGCGFDLSEIDLWWLLNRRQREKANKGKVYYYDPACADKEKIALLKLLDVDTDNRLGFGSVPEDKEEKSEYFRRYYTAAVDDIIRRTGN
jgi:hypothetical protein